MNMANIDRFHSIISLPGIDQYILVDQTGKIYAHNAKIPEKLAEITSTCGFKSHAVGKTKFSHIMFSRKNHDNFFIFPVGKYYLGVVKQENINNALLVENVLRFLKDFPGPK
jgi:hypothetical protein